MCVGRLTVQQSKIEKRESLYEMSVPRLEAFACPLELNGQRRSLTQNMTIGKCIFSNAFGYIHIHISYLLLSHS